MLLKCYDVHLKQGIYPIYSYIYESTVITSGRAQSTWKSMQL